MVPSIIVVTLIAVVAAGTTMYFIALRRRDDLIRSIAVLTTERDNALAEFEQGKTEVSSAEEAYNIAATRIAALESTLAANEQGNADLQVRLAKSSAALDSNLEQIVLLREELATVRAQRDEMGRVRDS